MQYDVLTWQYVNSRTSKCLEIPSASPGYIWQDSCTYLNIYGQAFSFPSD